LNLPPLFTFTTSRLIRRKELSNWLKVGRNKVADAQHVNLADSPLMKEQQHPHHRRAYPQIAYVMRLSTLFLFNGSMIQLLAAIASKVADASR
jgi:hypothetical protein